MTPTFKTRSELYASLNYDLEQNLNRYVSEGRSVYDQGWLKTQILEYGNKSISDSHNQILKDLLELISNSPEMELSETEEENLFAINVSDKEDGGEIYIDSSDHRFFTLFSKIKSNFFDRAVNRLTYNTLLDRAWFAMEILNSYRELGYFRGSGGKYDNRFFFGDELENAEFNESSQYSFKSWGKSDKLLKLIREDEELRHEFALTSVRIRKNLRDEELEHYIIDDISFQGKITSLGTSFSAHKSLLDPVKDLYRNIVVEKIENRLSLRHSSILEGEPIVILFPREMRVSLDFFAKKLFSGKKPFMLLGITESYTDDFMRVNAVDLHVGHRIMFEITPSEMKIYLNNLGCGNTVLRVYTLLQQTFDSLVKFKQEVFTENE